MWLAFAPYDGRVLEKHGYACPAFRRLTQSRARKVAVPEEQIGQLSGGFSKSAPLPYGRGSSGQMSSGSVGVGQAESSQHHCLSWVLSSSRDKGSPVFPKPAHGGFDVFSAEKVSGFTVEPSEVDSMLSRGRQRESRTTLPSGGRGTNNQMGIRMNHIVVSVVLAGVFLSGSRAWAESPDKPDIILIVADNLGHGDLSSYGCTDIKTPNIDRIAAQGVRFTNFYSNGPECSPTRTALLTGRYQQRIPGLECALGTGNVGRYDDAIALADKHELGLPPRETILIPLLNEQGYKTVGLGKWHLGYEKHLLPPHHGFDYFLASLGGTIDYFYHNEPTGEHVLYENLKHVRRDRYFTDVITDGAVEFLTKQPATEPIFLYLPFNAPSAPFQHPDRKPDRPKVSNKWDSKDWQKGDRATLRLIIERLDQGVGKIMETLKSTGRAENALVIFCSDNGAYPIAASNAPFRGFASELFEGGIHVACMARWPGKLPVGVVDDRHMLTFDLTASILAAAGCSPPRDRPLDGIDVLGRIAAGQRPESRTLFWRSRRADRTWKAVRQGNLKYIWRKDGDKLDEYLFDLSQDPAESNNLFGQSTHDASPLKQQLVDWEREIKSPPKTDQKP
jgi:arylsulfatase A-like enzyme